MRQIPFRALDQFVNSTSSALFSVGLVAVTTDAELGSVALAATPQPLLLGLVRTGVSEAILIRGDCSDRDGIAWLPTAAGVLAGVLSLLVTFLAGLLLDLSKLESVALGSVGFAVLVFDGLRFTGLIRERGARTLAADVAWLVLSATGVTALMLSNRLDLTWLCWAYAFGAMAGALVLIPVTTTGPFAAPPTWLRRQLRFGSDFFLQIVPGQATLLLAAAVTSLASVGVLRAAVTLYNPLTTAVAAVRLTILDRRTHSLASTSAIYGAVAVVYTVALIGTFRLTPSLTSDWLGELPVIVLVWVGIGEIARHVTQARIDHHRVADEFRQALLLRAVQAVLLVSLSVWLGAMANSSGLAGARALAFWIPILLAVTSPIARNSRHSEHGRPL